MSKLAFDDRNFALTITAAPITAPRPDWSITLSPPPQLRIY